MTESLLTTQNLTHRQSALQASSKLKYKIFASQSEQVQEYPFNMSESTKMDFPELDLGLALSKAEGNLNFLAKATNTEGDQTLTITQGMAILDALHAVQEARKKLQVVLYEQRKK